jgi:simple sugar transport system substrate-binding protein
MVEMSQLIDAVVASRPAGLAMSIPDGDALAMSIRAAAAAEIPLVSINSGADVFRDLGVRAHLGLPERDAGYAAGRRMGAAGVARVLCVNHEVGNVALDERCAGLADGLRESGGSALVLAVDLADPEDAQQRIGGALGRDPGIDGILTLGPAGAVPALAALASRQASGETDVPQLATFDLSLPVLEAVRDGEMSFAIDQQPYLQGYLAVVFLHKAIQIGAVPDGVIRTGPAFVTGENAAEVIRLVGRGVR